MRKYIKQIDNPNFIYPNNTLAEYDVDIVHDINNNSVTGSTSSFTATLVGSNIVISFSYNWALNGADPYIDDANLLHILSVHMMEPTTQYYKPWRMVSGVTTSSIGSTTYTGNLGITVTPAMMGVPAFLSGNYYFEVRFIGKRAVYPECETVAIQGVTPTPTPTPSATMSNITPTPTATSNNTPTPTPSSTPITPTYSFKLGTGTTSTNACNNYDPDLNNTFWSYDSVLDNGTQLYTVGDYPLSGTPPNNYYSDGTYSWYVTSGYMVGEAICSFTPTPTPTPTALGVGFGIATGTTFGSSGAACTAALYPGPTIYLTAGDTTPTVGDYFYLDQYTTPGNTFVGNSNYYCVRRGGTLYAIQISSGGQITAVTTC